MTTDASPVNRYLLFDRADDFRTSDKIMYALRTGRVFENGKEMNALGASASSHGTGTETVRPGSSLESGLQKRFLVRTLDEVKRGFSSFGDRQLPPVTPSTDATAFTNAQSAHSSPEMLSSHNFNVTVDTELTPLMLEDNEELDARPWDNIGAQATYWSWPIETLYQNYHVVHAIDFGQSTFDVSSNGEVFADRIPSIVSALLHVIETTLRARDRSVSAIKAWLAANVASEETHRRVLAQVWDPTILVSIILINAPKSLEAAVPFTVPRHKGTGLPRAQSKQALASDTNATEAENGEEDEEDEDGTGPTDEVPIFPPSHTRFTAFEADGGTDKADNTLVTGIPILSRVDARRLIQDATVVERLRETLLMYENACRQRGKDAWPESNLSSTIEYLVRTAPEATAECHSLVLTTNTRSMFCTDTLSFLESVVRRKNLVISVVALNRRFAIDSPRLSPLAQFLSSVGGFAVHIDYWLSLAATRLNSDWCQRFEGARCLAQQLFVHLVNHFPVASYGITQRHAFSAEQTDRVVLYDSEKGLPDFVTGSSRSTLSLLRAVAEARFNEGWSVLIDYKDESTAAHLVARAQHCFHRGALVLHYEMDINRPAVYRRLLISGTRALVDHFYRLRVDELGMASLNESVGTWLTYLALLRLQLHSWLRAEQTMLELLNMGPRTAPALKELRALTSFTGVMAEWLNMCSVSSVGLFFRQENVIPGSFAGNARGTASSPLATMPTAKALVRRAMLQQHRQVGGDDELTFVRIDDGSLMGGPFLYVVQCFPFYDAAAYDGSGGSAAPSGGVAAGIAGGYECRVSFFLCDREAQQRLLLGITDTLLKATCAGTATSTPTESRLGSPASNSLGATPHSVTGSRLSLSASATLVNQQAVLLVISAMSPRRMELLSYYTENIGSVPSPNSPTGASTFALQPGSPLARPPLAKGTRAGGFSPATPVQAASRGSAWQYSVVLQRTLRAPYVAFPWALANARSFKWLFTCEDRFDNFYEDAFKFFIMRRVRVASNVLVCYNAIRKAVLHREVSPPGAGEGEKVNIFDLIEGLTTMTPSASARQHAAVSSSSSLSAGWGPDTSFSIYRLATPYKHIDGCMSTRTLIEDIAEDVHIVTALYSYKVFSRHRAAGEHSSAAGNDGSTHGMGGGHMAVSSFGPAERRTVYLQQQRALGATVIKARMDSLFGYLRAERMELMSFQSPRSLGENGCVRLHAKMAHLVASMGDRHVTASCSAFNAGLLRAIGVLPSSREAGDCGDDAAVMAAASNGVRLLVSLLYPIRYHTITFLIIAEKPCATAHSTRAVSVGIAFLDAALLDYGLTQRYCEEMNPTAKVPGWPGDTAVVTSIKHILSSFATIYTSKQLMNKLTATDGESGAAEDTQEMLDDLNPLFNELEVYATEADVTHLLRATEMRHGWTRGVVPDPSQLQQALQKAIATLALLGARSFPSRPAVFFPAFGGTSKAALPPWLSTVSGSERNGADAAMDVGVFDTTLPIAFACCVCLEKRRSDACTGDAAAPPEKEYFWLSSANKCDEAISFRTPEERDLSAPASTDHTEDGAGAAPSAYTRMTLRVFVKTVARELLDLFTEPTFLPPPRVVRAVLQYMLFRYKPGTEAPTGGERTGGSTGSRGRSATTARDKEDGATVNVVAKPLGNSSGGPSGAAATAPADPTTVRGADGATSVKALDLLWHGCLDFASFPDTVERAIRVMVVRPLVVKLAAFALHATFYTAGFNELRRQIMSAGATDADGKVTAAARGKDAGGTLVIFTQPSLSVCRSASRIAGISAMLRDVVAPALHSSTVFQSAVFPVEFTQQATTYRSVDPKEAALDVFRRCVEEDHMCIIPTTKEHGYAVVPNGAFFGKRWILVQMEIQPSLLLNKASILYFDAEPPEGKQDGRGPHAVSSLLQTHIYTKITQISQLHLLKQLRDSQYANTELVPLNWGNQFTTIGTGTTSSRGGITGVGSTASNYARNMTSLTAGRNAGQAGQRGAGAARSATNEAVASGSSTSAPSTSFYLRGTDVLRIPIYYKLQQYCHKLLNFVTNNSTRLELFQVYNREQCFVVADDEEGDIFHYIRLVFVKDLGQTVSATQPSPQLSQSDRCPEMVVQLFTATSNASIRRPLRKLQDFCYYLAVQELQGHLNYVNSISFNDLVFLQNQPLAPIVIDVSESPGGETTNEDVPLVLSLLFLNLRENKFKLLDFQDGEQSHTKSVFVKHYILDEEDAAGAKQGKGAGVGSANRLHTPSEPHPSSTAGAGGEPSSEAASRGAEANLDEEASAKLGKQRTMRFVKVADGQTDVLCSCALRWCEDPSDPRAHLISMDRFLTKVPSERYINGESERAIMKQLGDLVEDTKAQLAFHVLSRSQRPCVPLPRVPECTEDLLSIAERVTSAESSLLRFRAFSLDDVSPAVFPYLVERLCGAVRPFSPRCCEGDLGDSASLHALTNFSWAWMEKQQNNPTTDQHVVYVMCGYNIGVDDAPEAAAATIPEAHVLPYSIPELALTATTTEEHQIGVLREQGLSSGGPVMGLRVVMKISLMDGLCVGVFNMRDSDYLLRMLSHVVHEMEEKSWLLQDILMQRLGFAVPSAFNEADLARNCCGDATNVLQNKTLAITGDTYRRRVNNVRFRPHLEDAADDLAVIVEGLYNRGLIVNYVFPVEDAIAVLFNERGHYTLRDCEQVLESFLRDGVLVKEPDSALRAQVPLLRTIHIKGSGAASVLQPFNCRLAEVSGVPADALIACDYHRHVLATHIIVEAQNARSEVAEVLSECDALWQAGPQDNVLALAKSIVTLQMKSKQVFGARVPDFSLRRERWTPSDDILDENLPLHGGRGPTLATAVDAAMRSYIHHLRQLYPSMCIIDLDPADPLTTNEEVLLNRLKCRYGKVTPENGTVMRFGTHLYYAVIPFADLLRCKGMHERYGHFLPMVLPPVADAHAAASTPITSSGLFVVEVGFQVVHYALDFFVVSGTSVPLSVAAKVAADFKQSLLFDSFLYDSSVQHLQERLRSYTADLPGYVDMATAAANLVKYYPSPPANSVHIADVFRITDPRVMRLRGLAPGTGARTSRRDTAGRVQQRGSATDGGGDTTASDTNAGSCSTGSGQALRKGFLVLVPERNGKTSLLRSRTGESYLFCGLILWETAQLVVLLSTEKDPSHCMRVPNDDLPGMVLQAKRLLLMQLLESTQQERLDAAWDKFLCDCNSGSGGGEKADAAVGDPTFGSSHLTSPGSRGHALARTPVSPLQPKDLPSYDEFELLRSHCQRVVLQSYRPVLQSMVGDVEWVGDSSNLLRAAQALFPNCVVRVLWKPTRTTPTAAEMASGAAAARTRSGAGSPSSSPNGHGPAVGANSGIPSGNGSGTPVGPGTPPPVVTGRGNESEVALLLRRSSSGFTCGSPLLPKASPLSASGGIAFGSAAAPTANGVGGYDAATLFSTNGLPGRVIFTFARNDARARSFLAMECWSMPGCEPPFVVEDISFFRRPDEGHQHLSLVATLSRAESRLLLQFMKLITNAMFATIIPCSSQVMA